MEHVVRWWPQSLTKGCSSTLFRIPRLGGNSGILLKFWESLREVEALKFPFLVRMLTRRNSEKSECSKRGVELVTCDTPWTEIVVMSALSEVCQTKMMANMSSVNHVEPTTPPLSFTTIVIRLLETREGRGKETRVSRAFGSKENPLNSSNESTCFSLCWFC